MKPKVKNTVENTLKTLREDFETVPLRALFAGTPEAIVASEHRGQVQFVESDILPAKLRSPGVDDDARKILQAWGFQLGKGVGGDSLFIQGKLPEGWAKQGSDHDMWSYIVDDKGRRRCAIFYKAAFYDRDASLNIESRYRRVTEYADKENRSGPVRGTVTAVDGVEPLWVGPWRETPEGGKSYETHDQASKDAAEWFKANLPESVMEQWAR